MQLPLFDSGGFLEAIERRRREFPGLRILAGLEFGQPHLWEDKASELLSGGLIQRVNGSRHMLDDGTGGRTEPATLYRLHEPDSVMWAYLEEIPRMVANSTSFEVFAHIDYPVRSWPTETAGPVDPRKFEEGFRMAMRAIAASGRALELNTRRLWPDPCRVSAPRVSVLVV